TRAATMAGGKAPAPARNSSAILRKILNSPRFLATTRKSLQTSPFRVKVVPVQEFQGHLGVVWAGLRSHRLQVRILPGVLQQVSNLQLLVIYRRQPWMFTIRRFVAIV